MPLYYLGMVVINIIYNVLLISFFPLLIIGSFVWGNKKFWEINNFLLDMIPTIPDFDGIKIEKEDEDK